LRSHVPRHRLGEEEGAAQIHSHDLIERLQRHIEQIAARGRSHAGIVYQAIDRTALRNRLLYEARMVFGIGKIAAQENACASRGLDPLQRGQRVGILFQIRNRDIEARACECHCDGGADAAPRAGDQRNRPGRHARTHAAAASDAGLHAAPPPRRSAPD